MPETSDARHDIGANVREDAADQVRDTVAGWWRDLLMLDAVPLDEDFFDLGGESLTLVRFLTSVEQEYGVELPLVELFADDLTVLSAEAMIRRTLAARSGTFDSIDGTSVHAPA